jgi:hypothetical protein
MTDTLVNKSNGDLIWLVGGKVMEVIERNKPFLILNGRKKSLEETGQYSSGVLETVGYLKRNKYNY